MEYLSVRVLSRTNWVALVVNDPIQLLFHFLASHGCKSLRNWLRLDYLVIVQAIFVQIDSIFGNRCRVFPFATNGFLFAYRKRSL